MAQSHVKDLGWKRIVAFLIVGAIWIGGWIWVQRHDSALLKAIIIGDVQAARRAFNDGATMRMQIRHDFTFLQVAARQGSVEMAELLVEHGAAATVNATNQNGDTALDIALASGHTNMADYLRSLTTIR